MSTDNPPTGGDSGAATRLQILATEHWSLLATRSLTYTESLTRVTIFLAILSGAVIALALVAQADHFGLAFSAIAIFVLSVVLFAGIATISRLNMLNRDDYRWVVGMNRLRNAYLEMHPELEPHFITSKYDDLPGALQTLGIDLVPARRSLGSAFHLLQTLPGMLTVIVGAVGGAIGALVALVLNLPPVAMVVAAVVGFGLVVGLMRAWGRQAVTELSPSLEPRFKSPVDARSG
jgi:small basic protein